MGEAPSVRGFFVGAGFNSVGIASAGGAGRALAEWVVEGEPTSDLVAVDLRRFARVRREHRRGCATGSWRSSACTTPCRGRTASWRAPGRCAARRCTTGSPPRNAALRVPGRAGSAPTTSRRPGRRRGRRTRGGSRTGCPGRPRSSARPAPAVAVFDQTSFSKYLVVGPDAEAALQWICTDRRRGPGRHGRLHRAAEPARHLRVRPDRHPGVGRRSTSWSAARPPPSATWTTSGGTSRPATTPGWST